jgi:hypothetical protein
VHWKARGDVFILIKTKGTEGGKEMWDLAALLDKAPPRASRDAPTRGLQKQTILMRDPSQKGYGNRKHQKIYLNSLDSIVSNRIDKCFSETGQTNLPGVKLKLNNGCDEGSE